MLKRLIEVALPLKDVSEQCVRESKVREGHIRTLHIWWARRPLAACRAVVFASLIPDPDDPECPEQFRQLVLEVLEGKDFRPSTDEGSVSEDTPRNRCLEFIKKLVKWENSTDPTYIGPARHLVAAAHKFLHPDTHREAPRVLDPFAGGGAIPLEALRLGCEAHAVELNPVAHLIELCTLVYPQQYGQPESHPVPEYIKRLIAHNRAKTKAERGAALFDRQEDGEVPTSDDLIPDIEITEAEYRLNPLAADVKYWGNWVLGHVRRDIGSMCIGDFDGGFPLAYLWARTVTCPNPKCRATIPLVRQFWLCKKANRKVAMRLVPVEKTKRCRFEIVEGKQIDFDPNKGTVQQGKAACPFCPMVVDGKTLRAESKAKRMGQQMMVVVTSKLKQKGKSYRPAGPADEAAYHEAVQVLETAKGKSGANIVPDEPITVDRPSPNSRGLSAVVRYGLDKFGDLYNSRQALGIITVLRHLQRISPVSDVQDDLDRIRALKTLVACALDKCLDFASTLCRWGNDDEGVTGTFGRQALQMVWDYAESNLLQDRTGGLGWAIRFPIASITKCSEASKNPCVVRQGNASTKRFF
jgi:adenine-specific DNA methylase